MSHHPTTPGEAAAAPGLAAGVPAADPGELYQRLGEITRKLHDALRELGYDQKLRGALDSLPDARTRLAYVTRLTGEAADKVLTRVDRAKEENDRLAAEAEQLELDLGSNAADAARVERFVAEVRENAAALDAHLTEIMMAQDFHDLTGQVIRKIVEIAQMIEEQLLDLLIEATPAHARPAAAPTAPAAAFCNGPAVNLGGKVEVARNQADVDDLLASLGF